MDDISLKQLEEIEKELFNQQCSLDIQKAMVRNFIKAARNKALNK